MRISISILTATNKRKMSESVAEFDKTVEAMLNYAKEESETLIAITADCEIGGITPDKVFIFTQVTNTLLSMYPYWL